MPRIVRFDCFEVDLAAGEFRKRGRRIRLPRRSGPRAKNCSAGCGPRACSSTSTWLNIAVARLRAALGDAPDRARFVETVPRRG